MSATTLDRAALGVGTVVDDVRGRLASGVPETAVTGFSIDSRTIGAGDLFIAIRGDRFDGHDFVARALDAGAGGAVVSTVPDDVTPERLAGRPLVIVADTTAALQDLARAIRRRAGARIVGVTGSTGKTTTKEMVATLLAARHRVLRSGGNLNNHIGLPLSLLALRRGADVAVVELGMSRAGEISRLVAIADPDVRVWTNVAEVHAAFFSSLEAIADAKAELLEGARADTLLVANADDPLVMARIRSFPGRTVTFGLEAEATVRAVEVEDHGVEGTSARVRTPVGELFLRVSLLGRGNLANALASVAVAVEFDVPLEDVVERARGLKSAAHRSDVRRLASGVTVIDDSYNSNPRALQLAIEAVSLDRRHARRVLVLGEMRELGARGLALHEACGRLAAESGAAALFTVGGEAVEALGRAAVAAGMRASTVRHASTSEDAAPQVVALVRPGDLVLVKGSRGIGTERVVEALVSAFD